MNRGLLAREYVVQVPIKAQPQQLLKTVGVEATGVQTKVHLVSIPSNAALVAEIVAHDAAFFSQQPTLSHDGELCFTSTRRGCTKIDFRVLDAASVDASGNLQSRLTSSVDVVIESRTLLNRPVRDAAKNNTASASAAAAVAPQRLVSSAEVSDMEKGPVLRKLQLPGIREFRNVPPRPRLKSFAPVVAEMLPLLLTRQWNAFAEYEQATQAQGTAEHAIALLRKIYAMIETNTVVEAVVPLIDAACRLHTKLGGQANLDVAVRLAHMRVHIVATALGIDVKASPIIDVAAMQRLAGGRRDSGSLLIRVLVESAHLLKLLGHFNDALRYYKAAAAAASAQQKAADGSAGQIPFLFAAAEVHMMAGDLPSAVQLFEEARAHAEVASRGSAVVAECEQQLAFAFTALGMTQEADVALKRAHHIRREQNEHLATAETLIFEAACLVLKSKADQALVCLRQARDLSKLSGSRARFVEAVVEAVCGVITVFLCGAADDHGWDADVCQQCPSTSMRAFSAWLERVQSSTKAGSNSPVDRFDAQREAVIHECGNESSMATLFSLSSAIETLETDAAAGASAASHALGVLTAQCSTSHPMLLLALEATTICQTLSGNSAAAIATAQRLAWQLGQQNTPSSFDGRSLTPDTRYRLSSCLAEASVKAGKPIEGDHVIHAFGATLGFLGELHGHFSTKLVPVLLDFAEVRYIRGDFSDALELFGKALRIVDVKNLLYLVGPLFTPRWLLTTPEVRDRDRLAIERSPGNEGFTALAMLLHQLGLTHESSGNPSRAVASFQHSLACFEMAGLEHHPGCLAVLTSLGRCHLALGENATARFYLERGQDLFLDHFYHFGEYRKRPHIADIKRRLDATLRSARVAETGTGTLLCKADTTNPALMPAELYC